MDEVVEARRAVYGEPDQTFEQKARLWTAFLGDQLNSPLRADQVASMMILFKLVRANQTPNYSDNIDDVQGYADIFKRIIGDDMIEARSVPEYIEKLLARKKPKLELVQDREEND